MTTLSTPIRAHPSRRSLATRLLIVGGVMQVVFALFHAGFPWSFDWNDQLAGLSGDNEATVWQMWAQGTYVLVVFAYLSFVHRHALLESRIGRAVAAAIAIFYFGRALTEAVFGDIATSGSVTLAVICVAVGLLYAVPLVLTQDRGGGR